LSIGIDRDLVHTYLDMPIGVTTARRIRLRINTARIFGGKMAYPILLRKGGLPLYYSIIADECQ